jgi:fused signal recognition particle receptor
MKDFFKKGFQKTIDAIKALDDALLIDVLESIKKESLEEILIESDVNYSLIQTMLDELPEEIEVDILRPRMLACFKNYDILNSSNIQKPFVELIIGVNGAGKTTTIAKLATKYKKDNKKVLLGAADTFRAAAIEQLTRWAKKIDVPIISSSLGHDPSGVTYDTIASGVARGVDHIIIDTAGRLHTQTNLANELKKIVRVSDKAYGGAPHRKILILDGTQGTSAINQAKVFNDMIGIDGIIITKLDGTARGGAIFSIAEELGIPILYVGVGEKAEDLINFKPEEFVDGLLDKLYHGAKKI